MAEDNTPTPTPNAEEEPKYTQAHVDRMVKDRLKRAESKYSDYDELKAKADKFDELEAANKSEMDKLTESAAAERTRADEAEGRALRLEVAASKGLTPVQARRLVGSTQEELEADADELLTSFAPPEPTPRPGDLKPSEQLTPAGADSAGGGDDIDYDALARSI